MEENNSNFQSKNIHEGLLGVKVRTFKKIVLEKVYHHAMAFIRIVKRVKSTGYYQTDTMPRTDASLLAHLAPSFSCSSSGCQTSSWSAVGCRLKTKLDHDHPRHVRSAEMSQSCVKWELPHLVAEEAVTKLLWKVFFEGSGDLLSLWGCLACL